MLTNLKQKEHKSKFFKTSEMTFETPFSGWNQANLMLPSREIASFLKATCEKGVPFKFTVKGMSMSPFICNGDSVIIKPLLSEETIEEGNIVAFITPEGGNLIIHRIIKKNSQYLLKGDNVYHNDGYYKQKYIYGYVTKIITDKNKGNFHRVIRKLFLFLNNFKKILAFLSRYKILAPICRLTNKVMNEK